MLTVASQDSVGAKGTLGVDGKSYVMYRLDAVNGEGIDVESLPFSLKVLLENLLRTEDGADITAEDIKALAGWDADAEPSKEIQFTPSASIAVRLPRDRGDGADRRGLLPRFAHPDALQTQHHL